MGIIGIVFYVNDKIRAHALLQQPTTDLLINITDGQPPVAVRGLDDATIESYRKIELSEHLGVARVQRPHVPNLLVRVQA